MTSFPYSLALNAYVSEFKTSLAFLYIGSFACNLLQNVKLYLVSLKRYNPFPLNKLNEYVIWKRNVFPASLFEYIMDHSFSSVI